MSLISQKQINYIVWRVKEEFPVIFQKIPKNNEKYPRIEADYRRMILADMIKNYTHRNAETIIHYINQGMAKELENYIFGIK